MGAARGAAAPVGKAGQGRDRAEPLIGQRGPNMQITAARPAHRHARPFRGAQPLPWDSGRAPAAKGARRGRAGSSRERAGRVSVLAVCCARVLGAEAVAAAGVGLRLYFQGSFL